MVSSLKFKTSSNPLNVDLYQTRLELVPVKVTSPLKVPPPDGMNPVIDCQEQVPSPSSLKNLVAPLSPVDNIAVPSGVALIVCQVLSPLRNLVLTELPDPSLATLTVPELRFDAFKAVKLEPSP